MSEGEHVYPDHDVSPGDGVRGILYCQADIEGRGLQPLMPGRDLEDDRLEGIVYVVGFSVDHCAS
jgi:hypothetical protein